MAASVEDAMRELNVVKASISVLDTRVEEVITDRTSYRAKAEQDINNGFNDMKARVLALETALTQLNDGRDDKFNRKFIRCMFGRRGEKDRAARQISCLMIA